MSNINRSVRTSFSGLYDDGRRVCAIGAEGTLCKKYETAIAICIYVGMATEGMVHLGKKRGGVHLNKERWALCQRGGRLVKTKTGGHICQDRTREVGTVV